MKTILSTEAQRTENIIQLPVIKQVRNAPIRATARFKIQKYTNPRTESISWRVTGSRRDRTRIRENFSEQEAARCRQVELETEYLGSHSETAIRATKLSTEQLALAETAFIKLGDDWMRILDCVDHWKKHGQQNTVLESPRLDDAVEQFQKWVAVTDTLRKHTRPGLKNRVNVFANSVQNYRVNEIKMESIEEFLGKLKVSAVTRDNYRRAISRFFSWCIEKPRQWTAVNPCKEIKIKKPVKPAPAILTVDQCKKLLEAAQVHGLANYVAVCLFGGLRPFEALRLEWPAVNLKDGEIRLEAAQVKTGSKTGQGRVVTICPTLKIWLSKFEGQKFYPSNWRKKFDAVKLGAGITKWPVDVMRHTAISHYFRKTGSYGETAEQFGNSEGIIKKHYKSRVTSDDTKAFYGLKPGV